MQDRIIVIGASLYGIAALMRLVRDLPRNLNAPVLITQHVASDSPGVIPHMLSGAGVLPAMHLRDGQELQKGHIYVAPPDRHMLVARGRIRLSHGPKENMSRPAIDPLFRSAALEYGAAAVGVILTGQLNDGTAGLMSIKDRGGIAIVQQPSDAEAPSMPRSALKHVAADHCCVLEEIAPILTTLAADSPGEDATASRVMEIENRIAAGVSTIQDWRILEEMSTPSGFNCPGCRSSLWVVPDQRMLRFRCRAGHGLSAESLISAQADTRENAFASVLAALVEEASLLERLTQSPELTDEPDAVAHVIQRAERLREQAGQVASWLRATIGLVEPEPAAQSRT